MVDGGVTETPPPPATPGPVDARVGMIGSLITIVKGLTFTNVLIIGLLVAIAVPAYFGWRTINDTALLDRFTAHYEEIANDKSPCAVRIFGKGQVVNHSVTTGFAYQGSDRWIVGVVMDSRPTEDEIVSYCATLNLIVDFMRRPDAKSPTYPGSDEPLIWQYKPPDEVP